MTNKRIAVLFAGQGAQEVGMGKDLAETYPEVSDMCDAADKTLGRGLSQHMFRGPIGELTRTVNCQPALYIHGLALLHVLKKELPEFHFESAAGLSLGEFTAHAAAGTFSYEDGLKLVAARGEFMEEACRESDGSMAAMIGGKTGDVQQLAEENGVDIANLNAPGQIVISGDRGRIQKCLREAKEYGIRKAVELKVAGAYHSRLMTPAKQKLEEVLVDTDMQQPRIDVISNFSAMPVTDEDNIRATLASQVTGSVRWAQSIQLLINSGTNLFIELGPGGVLAGLMARIDKNAQTLSIGNLETLQGAVKALREMG